MSHRFSAAIAGVALAVLAACNEQPGPLEPSRLVARAQPLVIATPASFSHVTAGEFHTCGLRNDGAVECWGDNTVGQAPPAPIVAAVGKFTAVDAGIHYVCALREDGAVECWGWNTDGQAPATPRVTSAGKFTAVDAGVKHTCGLRDDGAIECWGDNSEGQAPPEPKLAAVGKFTAVSAGRHTCALRDDGAVECWGFDGSGQAPITPKVAGDGGEFTAVDAGTSHTCAVRDDGVVECWGSNSDGKAPPTRVPAAGKFTSVDANATHTCGVRDDGPVECWGSSRLGSAPATPIVAAVGQFTAAAAGFWHSCARRTDGVVQCWGFSHAGQAPATRTATPIQTHVNPTATFSAPSSVIVGQSIALGLTNAQVPGHPEATAFTYAFDCGTGYAAASTAASANCATTAAGTRTVRAKVIDTDGDVGEYTKTVTVLSGSSAITQLKAAIAAESGVSATLRNPLRAKLDAALTAIGKNKTAVACAALGDFEAQVIEKRGKGIPVATANAWLLTAGQIKTAIGCSVGG